MNPENVEAGLPINVFDSNANVISLPFQLASGGIKRIFGPISGSANNLVVDYQS